MLLGLDDTRCTRSPQSFAGVAGSDPQWNDGHYVCLGDRPGTVCLTSNVRLYQNNDVLDGFVCLRHEGRQHNIRLSRRLRPDMEHFGVGPLRHRDRRADAHDAPRPRGQRVRHRLDVLCHSTVLPYEDPVEVTRVDGRLLSERPPTSWPARARAGSRWRASAST